jgi:hypothetical protein
MARSWGAAAHRLSHAKRVDHCRRLPVLPVRAPFRLLIGYVRHPHASFSAPINLYYGGHVIRLPVQMNHEWRNAQQETARAAIGARTKRPALALPVRAME